jgi:hypothetical protein
VCWVRRRRCKAGVSRALILGRFNNLNLLCCPMVVRTVSLYAYNAWHSIWFLPNYACRLGKESMGRPFLTYPDMKRLAGPGGARMQYLALGITFARIRSADSFPKRGSFPSIESLVWVSQGQDAASSITCYFFRIRSADSLMRYRGEIPLQHDSRD